MIILRAVNTKYLTAFELLVLRNSLPAETTDFSGLDKFNSSVSNMFLLKFCQMNCEWISPCDTETFIVRFLCHYIVLFYDCYFKNCFITLLQHVRGQSALCCQINVCMCVCMYVHCGSKKNAPTLAYYNYDPVQSILIIFSKLFVNDHKSCLVVKFSTSPHVCCHYTLWNTMLYFALITLLIARNAPTSDHRITSISVKEF